MKLKFIEKPTRKLVNVQKHVDGGWFWNRYSAHPTSAAASAASSAIAGAATTLANGTRQALTPTSPSSSTPPTTYDLELEMAHQARIWAYRKAAWAIDELEQPLDELYLKDDEAGLAKIPGIGKPMAAKIGDWLERS